MIFHRVYKCPKCFNTLLVSNKMLHDLRCTVENPATYENILFRQSQQISDNSSYNNYNNSDFGERMSIKNDDGTMIDIRKEKSLRGKDEYVEIKYDPQGNVISRKKASNHGYGGNEFSEFDDYEDDDFSTNYDNSNSTYYEINKEPEIRKSPSVIVETAEPQEIVYEAPAKYDPNVTVNKPIYEDTYINSTGEISDKIMNDIIRNTLTRNDDNNNFGNNINIQKDSNINGYDYSQNYSQNYSENYSENYSQNYLENYSQNHSQNYSKDYSQNKKQNSNSYNQDYNMNNNINQFNYGDNEIYNESKKENGNKTADKNDFNFTSYDYQY